MSWDSTRTRRKNNDYYKDGESSLIRLVLMIEVCFRLQYKALTLWNRTLGELIVTQLVKSLRYFAVPEGSFPSYRELDTGLVPELHGCGPRGYIIFLKSLFTSLSQSTTRAFLPLIFP
jgi:hypothetical protein